MTTDLRHRARLLFVALSALQARPAVACLHGIGLVAVGMARQGFDLELTRYGGEGWRGTFYPEGRSHSPTQYVGTAWERTPWRAV